MAWQSTKPSLLVRMRDLSDQAAWADFDRQYGELILRYSLGRGLQLSDAEDVRQIVLMSLARALPGFQYSPTRGRFRGYLGRIVHNAIARYATRPHRTREALVLDDDVLAGHGGEDPPDDSWEREWVNHHLRRAMRTIRRTFDPRSVTVFERFLAGASAVNIAEELEMSTDAVQKAKQRIRNRLKDLVAAQIAEEEGLDEPEERKGQIPA